MSEIYLKCPVAEGFGSEVRCPIALYCKADIDNGDDGEMPQAINQIAHAPRVPTFDDYMAAVRQLGDNGLQCLAAASIEKR